jgi:hypothetical protein
MMRVFDISSEAWARVLEHAPFIPLQQSPAYASSLAKRGRDVLRLVAEDDAPIAGMLLARRRIGGIPLLASSLRGPLMLSGGAMSAATIAALIAKSGASWPQCLLLAPELADETTTRAALREARLRPIMTGQSLAILSLAGTSAERRARLDAKWRNRLVRAEASGLKIEVTRGGASLEWLLNAHDRLMRRKTFRGLPRDFVMDLVIASARREIFLVTASRGRDSVAGGLFLRHGHSATYVVAAVELDGRSAHAGNLVLWRGIEALADAGVRQLDLGLVDTNRSPQLAHFKLATGAEPLTLCGTWTPFPF